MFDPSPTFARPPVHSSTPRWATPIAAAPDDDGDSLVVPGSLAQPANDTRETSESADRPARRSITSSPSAVRVVAPLRPDHLGDFGERVVPCVEHRSGELGPLDRLSGPAVGRPSTWSPNTPGCGQDPDLSPASESADGDLSGGRDLVRGSATSLRLRETPAKGTSTRRVSARMLVED